MIPVCSQLRGKWLHHTLEVSRLQTADGILFCFSMLPRFRE